MSARSSGSAKRVFAASARRARIGAAASDHIAEGCLRAPIAFGRLDVMKTAALVRQRIAHQIVVVQKAGVVVAEFRYWWAL